MISRLAMKLRRGEGPFWGMMKRVLQALLRFHIPVNAVTRPVFSVLYRLHVLVRELTLQLLSAFWFAPLFVSQCQSVGPRFRMEQLPYLGGNGRIMIGSNVRLSGKSTIGFGNRSYDSPELVIGDHTFIGHGCIFRIGQSVRIGNHCLLAGGVEVLDMDGHPLDAVGRRMDLPTPTSAIAPVIIEDDVWIGAGAMILKGVTVGARSIIAARSVVTKNVPPDSIVGGNPARIIAQVPQNPTPAETPNSQTPPSASPGGEPPAEEPGNHGRTGE